MTHTTHPTVDELFDISDDRLRERASLKWSNVDVDVLPAWVAEMDVHLPPAIIDALQNAITRHDAGYPGSAEGATHAFSYFALDQGSSKAEPDQDNSLFEAATVGSNVKRTKHVANGTSLIMPLCT